jgi:hypothetical protein
MFKRNIYVDWAYFDFERDIQSLVEIESIRLNEIDKHTSLHELHMTSVSVTPRVTDSVITFIKS